jgi:CheY-like chemotaxis protein
MDQRMLLLVDDEILFHRLLQPHLEKAGFTIVVAINGWRAVELATRVVPTLIVLDLIMPEMDGLEALHRLKANETTRDIPVVVITSTYHSVTSKEVKTCGAVGFLTKPFSPAQLLAEIKRVAPAALAA